MSWSRGKAAKRKLLCLGLVLGICGAAQAVDGQWDPGFGDMGVASIRDPAQGEPVAASLRMMRNSPDGGVLVFSSAAGLGSSWDVVIDKFDAQGQPDKSFGSSGRVVHDINGLANFARDATVLPDGRIVVMQQCAQRSSLYLDLCVSRFDSKGNLDASYAKGGVLVSNYALEGKSFDSIRGSLQTNAAGALWAFAELSLPTDNGSRSTQFRFLRANEKGERDSAAELSAHNSMAQFGNNVVSMVSGLDAEQRPLLLIQYFHFSGGTRYYSLKRLLPSGAFDSGFSADLSALPSGANVNWLRTDPSGRIWLVHELGYYSPYRGEFAVARLLADGKRDLSFGTSGLLKGVPLPDRHHWTSAIRFRDGGAELTMRVTKTGSPEQILVLDIDANGVLKSQATVSVPTTATHTYVGVTRSASGRLLVMESAQAGAEAQSRVRAFGGDGQADTQFGTQGVAALSAVPTAPRWFDHLSVGSDHSMLVTGNGRTFAMTANGQAQRLPGTRAVWAKQQKIWSSAVGKDGKRYLLSEPDASAGLWGGRPVELAVSRLDAQGNLDSTFADNGMAKFAPSLFEKCPQSYIEQASMVVEQGVHLAVMMYCPDSESGSNKIALFRLDANGKPDEQFGSKGERFIASANVGNQCARQVVPIEARSSLRLALDSKGRPVVAAAWCDGSSSWGYEYLRLYRLSQDGKLDDSFGNQGTAVGHLWGGLLGGLVADQNDSWWLVSNAFDDDRPYITRVGSNGRVDKDPVSPSALDGRSAAGTFRVYGAVRDAKGRWYFAGAAGLQKSTVQLRAAVARLDANGQLDSSFGQNGRMLLENGVSDGMFFGARLSADEGSLTVWGRCQDTACVAKLDTASGQLASTTATLEFGKVTVNSNVEKSWTLENVGEGMLRLTKVKLDAPFTQSNDCTAGLAKGQKCTLKFTLRPTAVGDVQQTATVETGAGTVSIQLKAKVEAANTGGSGSNPGGGSGGGGGGGNGAMLTLLALLALRKGHLRH